MAMRWYVLLLPVGHTSTAWFTRIKYKQFCCLGILFSISVSSLRNKINIQL